MDAGGGGGWGAAPGCGFAGRNLRGFGLCPIEGSLALKPSYGTADGLSFRLGVLRFGLLMNNTPSICKDYNAEAFLFQQGSMLQ